MGLLRLPGYRGGQKNLRTQLERIIRRAGLLPWGKPFQNCRASRETELAAEFPIHVVTQWLGNTLGVAAKHYLHTRDEDFARAAGVTPRGVVQNWAQQGAERAGIEAPAVESDSRQSAVFAELGSAVPAAAELMSCPATVRTEVPKCGDYKALRQAVGGGGAESGAVDGGASDRGSSNVSQPLQESSEVQTSDFSRHSLRGGSDFARLAQAWPLLPAGARWAVMAIVERALQTDSGRDSDAG